MVHSAFKNKCQIIGGGTGNFSQKTAKVDLFRKRPKFKCFLVQTKDPIKMGRTEIKENRQVGNEWKEWVLISGKTPHAVPDCSLRYSNCMLGSHGTPNTFCASLQRSLGARKRLYTRRGRTRELPTHVLGLLSHPVRLFVNFQMGSVDSLQWNYTSLTHLRLVKSTPKRTDLQVFVDVRGQNETLIIAFLRNHQKINCETVY